MSELEDYISEIYALEQRIERLSIAAGVDLSRPDHVRAVIQETHVHVGYGDNHTFHLLREMLVMREYIEAHCDNEFGCGECRRIVKEANARLRKNGLKPHA